MSQRMKVILDTDIGTDIDDALCLSYLLAEERCDLLGITTVTGDTQVRARIADAICQSAGVEIPIYAGRQEVILTGRGQPEVPQGEVLDILPHRRSFPTDYLGFMQRTIRENPGEVTLLAVGPMTNVGLLFAMDPELPKMLKQTVMMIGQFLAGGAEWNALVDPVAAALVYRYSKNLSIGLDVTTKCVISAQEARSKFTGPILETVLKLAEVWFRGRDKIVFHDPLAGAVIFEPDLCTYRVGHVSVECNSKGEEGRTYWKENAAGNPHRIAVSVEQKRFFEHYFDTIANYTRE
ncbi:MAG: nucleoside hydrolase [Limnochordia bacterium]|nr:nucleoside hydrolase [Limnochordia bacterium]